MSLNISLPLELENRVRAHVASGLYGSASEVIREALRLFETYQQLQKLDLVSLRKNIALGIQEADTNQLRELSVQKIIQKTRRPSKKSSV